MKPPYCARDRASRSVPSRMHARSASGRIDEASQAASAETGVAPGPTIASMHCASAFRPLVAVTRGGSPVVSSAS